MEGPHLVESYASVVALLDMIIGDLVATNGDAMRRRIDRVESARSSSTISSSATLNKWCLAPFIQGTVL